MAKRPRRRRPVTAADLADYGSVTDGAVNVNDAAVGLGISPSAVRQAIRSAESDLQGRIFRMLSGRSGAAFGPDASPFGLLQAAFGRGPRGGSVNATLAADELGVAANTVRRWAAGTQKPSPQHLEALQAAARRAVSTKQGRRRATADLRRSVQGQKVKQGGRKISIDGLQGPSERQYARHRMILVDINPDQFEDMLTAYEDRGVPGLIAWLTALVDQDYLEDWAFFTIDEIGFEEPQ